MMLNMALLLFLLIKESRLIVFLLLATSFILFFLSLNEFMY